MRSFMCQKRFLVVVGFALCVASCGGQGAGADLVAAADVADSVAAADADSQQDGFQETVSGEAPLLTAVLVRVAGYDLELDLTDADGVFRSLVPEPAEFVVTAWDDQTPASELIVKLAWETVDGPMDVEVQDAEFQEGEWLITTQLEYGYEYLVLVEDQDGNVTRSATRLVDPPLPAAAEGSYQWPHFDQEGTLATKDQISVALDGSWTLTGGDGRWASGTIDQGEQGMVEEGWWAKTPPEGTVPDWRTESWAYWDELFFASTPFQRKLAGDGLIGPWTRTVRHQEPENGQLAGPAVAYDLVMEEGQYTWTETRLIDGTEESTVETGKWHQQENEIAAGYGGSLLVLEPETRDGVQLADPEARLQFFVIRADYYLLLSPWVRTLPE